MTDAVFGHDGSLAPLRDYHAALPEKGILLADDSHGVGVLGDHGRGSLEHWGIAYRRVIQTATFSKAFGVYGGVILGGPGLRKRLASGSGAFIGNTPLPPHLVSGIAAAIGVMGRSQARRQRLLRNLRTVTAGIGVGQKNFPVISVVPANEAERRRIVRNLSAAGIHPPFIRYPGGVANGFFRFAISSEHTRGQLEALIGALQGL